MVNCRPAARHAPVGEAAKVPAAGKAYETLLIDTGASVAINSNVS